MTVFVSRYVTPRSRRCTIGRVLPVQTGTGHSSRAYTRWSRLSGSLGTSRRIRCRVTGVAQGRFGAIRPVRPGLSLECSGEVEGLEKRFSHVDVLLTDGKVQRIIVGFPTNLVATLGPHVDGVDPCERERPFFKLWNDVGFLDGRGLTPALAAMSSRAAPRTRWWATVRLSS